MHKCKYVYTDVLLLNDSKCFLLELCSSIFNGLESTDKLILRVPINSEFLQKLLQKEKESRLTRIPSMAVSDVESTNTPPVPPRRKKRKGKFATTAKSPQRTSPGFKKADRKRLAPPPPPPRAARRVKSHTAKNAQEKMVSDNRAAEDAEESLNSLSSNEAGGSSQPSSLQFEDTDLIPTKETSVDASDKNDSYNGNYVTEPPKERPFPMFESLRKEPNRYPPLLFTLHDFQNVMSNTLQPETDTEAERTEEVANSLQDSLRDTFQHSLDDEENDLCFRVTTTNLPFEKCLDRWHTTFADQFIEKFEDSSRFVFEDYLDRSNRVNIRRSSAPMCYDSYEEQPPVPRLTKVRFVIESPSSSTPDHDLSEDKEDTCDSLQNIEPLADEVVEYSRSSSVQLTEITDEVDGTVGDESVDEEEVFEDPDEFGDVPFHSILKTKEDHVWPSLDNFTSNDLVQESFDESEDAVEPNNVIDSSISLDLQKESFESKWKVAKLKAIDLSKTEVSFTKPKIECLSKWDFVLGKVKDDSSKMEESQAVKDLSNQISGKENNIDVSEGGLKSTEEIVSEIIEQHLALSKVSNTLKREASASDEHFNTSERELKMDKSKDEDLEQTSAVNKAGNSMMEEYLISSKLNIEGDKKVSSTEKKIEADEKQLANSLSSRSTQEYKRKLFLNESYRNAKTQYFSLNESQEDTKSFEATSDSCCHAASNKPEEITQEVITKHSEREIENIKFSQNNSIDDEVYKKKENFSVPVNIRRNSFLENMLSEESAEILNISANCVIIAAHLKPSLTVTREELDLLEEDNKTEQTLASRLNQSIKLDSEIQRNLIESKEKEANAAVKSRSPKIIQSSKKNAGEAKCDVLNELLSNFSSIKLKPVSVGNQIVVEDSLEVTTAIQQNHKEETIESKVVSQTEYLSNKISELLGENLAQSSPLVQESCTQTINTLQDGISKETSCKCLNPKKKILSLDHKNYSVPLEDTTNPHDNEFFTQNSIHKQDLVPDKSNQLPSKSEKTQTSNPRSRIEASKSLKTSEVSANSRLVKVDVHRSQESKNDYDPEPSKSTAEVHVEGCRSDPTLPITGDAKVPSKTLQSADRSEKTDAEASELKRPGHGVNDDRSFGGKQLELSRRTISEEKSAIVRRIPRPHCNKNDNNRAATPVAVSDDQSRETFAITPGRVRSFVKYYEIRREATIDKDSKTNDRDKVDRVKMGHQSVCSIRRGLEARAIEEKTLDVRKDHFQGPAVTKSFEKLTGSAEKETKSAKPEIEQEEPSRVYSRDAKVLKDAGTKKTDQTQKSGGDSSTQSGKVKRKKSVKFQGGYTVIGARGPDENGSVGSSTNRDAKSTGKRKTPDRPTIAGAIFDGNPKAIEAEVFVDDGPCPLEKREITAQIHLGAERKECSGINRFVPKPDTPRLVFYCTV
ncbi:uncharacterized protein LOC143182064 [Calliopsis andreniformis]|uniref:uncharacterized protein LOC143182064 n=1 Tax=Calliopsis andreniformis TaxID=337506 RepID=UPI003FCD631C